MFSLHKASTASYNILIIPVNGGKKRIAIKSLSIYSTENTSLAV